MPLVNCFELLASKERTVTIANEHYMLEAAVPFPRARWNGTRPEVVMCARIFRSPSLYFCLPALSLSLALILIDPGVSRHVEHTTAGAARCGRSTGQASTGVLGCGGSHRNSTGVKFFRFPRDETFARRWVVLSRRADKINTATGVTVARRLAYSPPTKAIRVQYPAGSLRIFACWNRAGRCRWSSGFLDYLLFPPPLHSGASPFSSQTPSLDLKTSKLRAAQISSLLHCEQRVAHGVVRHLGLQFKGIWERRETPSGPHHALSFRSVGGHLGSKTNGIYGHAMDFFMCGSVVPLTFSDMTQTVQSTSSDGTPTPVLPSTISPSLHCNFCDKMFAYSYGARRHERNGCTKSPPKYGPGKREIPEETCRLAALFGTIPTCESPGVARPGLNQVRLGGRLVRMLASHQDELSHRGSYGNLGTNQRLHSYNDFLKDVNFRVRGNIHTVFIAYVAITERGGVVVTHWTRIREDLGSIPGPAILISKSLQANAGMGNNQYNIGGWCVVVAARVCSVHFDGDAYAKSLRHQLLRYSPVTSRKLRPDAVPTLHLPGTSAKTLSSADVGRLERRVARARRNLVRELLLQASRTRQAIVYGMEGRKRRVGGTDNLLSLSAKSKTIPDNPRPPGAGLLYRRHGRYYLHFVCDPLTSPTPPASATQWRVVKCCKVNRCLLTAVHSRCTLQEPVTTVLPGATECIPTTHKRAARDILHAPGDVSCRATLYVAESKLRISFTSRATIGARHQNSARGATVVQLTSTTLFYPVQAGKKRVKFSYGNSSQALPWESCTRLLALQQKICLNGAGGGGGLASPRLRNLTDNQLGGQGPSQGTDLPPR
ncbi:hypothetical protein PR048_008039 [Dryococelus australis]|uniref:C2H2-type domain-containing protein n=1 Tax=Dryococelus australis TaxID=614101 RepID=A0ABQ9HXL8_9NEOP|nr:hypothetical protein PR048_008039 [Dryococelus australis]